MQQVDENQKKFLVLEDETLGRCLIAGERLNQGDFILRDPPIVSGPSRESNLVCFNCYGSCDTPDFDDENDPSVCAQCGLPLCESCASSDDSSNLPIHGPECLVLSRVGRSASLKLLEDSSLLHEVVLIIRCLHLRDFPEKWNIFFGLESHVDDRNHTEIGMRAERVSGVIIGDLGITDVTQELVMTVCGILDTNSFEIPMPLSPGTIQAVYGVGCLVEHNCVPSGHRCFDSDLSLVLRAAIDLHPGDHLTITYTDSLWPTAERRSHLLYSKHFHCLCSRCRDPTEINTFLGALKCMKCSVGRVLPENPLEDRENLNWVCIDCLQPTPSDWVNQVNDQVSETIQAMEESGLTPEKCEKFLAIHSRILHPQHAHMLDVKHSLLHLLGHYEGYLLADLNNVQLQLKEDIARCLLHIAEKILPGISRLRGTTFYELFLIYQQRALNWSSTKSKKDVLSTFQTAEDFLKKSINYLQYEPKHQAEGQLAQRARGDLSQLSEFIQRLIIEIN